LAACGGWRFALRAAPLHWLYFLTGAAGFAVACALFLRRRRRSAAVGRASYDKISQEENCP
jgi:hypothetical protein